MARNVVAQTEPKTPEAYAEWRYANAITYYWKVAGRNKTAYKYSRYLAIVLGSATTFVAAVAASTYGKGHAEAFAIATAILAALLAILGGFGQSFQWGAAWREMVLVAERLEQERDRMMVSEVENRDPETELELLNTLIINESRGFFDRVMGSSSPGVAPPDRGKGGIGGNGGSRGAADPKPISRPET
jgi:hypothetical protein